MKKPLIVTSYHNHTTWSDGRATLDEYLEAARRAGIAELGISDHYELAPGRTASSWSMKPDNLDRYLKALEDATSQAQGLTLRRGLEADFFPETASELGSILGEREFDYVIGSVHTVNSFAVDSAADGWTPLSQEQVNEVWTSYWLKIEQLAQSRLFDIVGHIDLPKKFGFRATRDSSKEIDRALTAIADNHLAIELNTSGWHLPAQEAYPALSILSSACRLSIPLVVNADAHSTDNLTRDFDKAWSLALEAGYQELVRFERRKQIAVPFV